MGLPRKLLMLAFYQALNGALWLTELILALGSTLNRSLINQQSKLKHLHASAADALLCEDCKKNDDEDDKNQGSVSGKSNKKLL